MPVAKKSGLGRTQQIFVGVLLAPFAVASAGLFLDKIDAPTWVAFLQFLAVSVVSPFFGFGAAHKTLTDRKAAPSPDAPSTAPGAPAPAAPAPAPPATP